MARIRSFGRTFTKHCSFHFAGAAYRYAPKRAIADLPFALWMVLAKATPLPPSADGPDAEPCQSMLREHGDPL